MDTAIKVILTIMVLSVAISVLGLVFIASGHIGSGEIMFACGSVGVLLGFLSFIILGIWDVL